MANEHERREPLQRERRGATPGYGYGQTGNFGAQSPWGQQGQSGSTSNFGQGGHQHGAQRYGDYRYEVGYGAGPRDTIGVGGYFNPSGFGSGMGAGGSQTRDYGSSMGGSYTQGSSIGGSGYYGRGGGYGQGRYAGQGGDQGRGGYSGLGAGMGGIASGATHYGEYDNGPLGAGDERAAHPQRDPSRPRGPKNYRRSDERLQELVAERLIDEPYLDSSDVEVHVHEGEVRLTGTVEDRDAKYHIEELVDQIHGVRDIDNRLKTRHGLLSRLFGHESHEGEHERSSGARAGHDPGGYREDEYGSRSSGGWTTAGSASSEGPATDQSGGSQGGTRQYGRPT